MYYCVRLLVHENTKLSHNIHLSMEDNEFVCNNPRSSSIMLQTTASHNNNIIMMQESSTQVLVFAKPHTHQ